MICVISGSNYMVGIRLAMLGLFNYETLSSLGFYTFDQCRTLWQLVGDFGIGFGHDGRCFNFKLCDLCRIIAVFK